MLENTKNMRRSLTFISAYLFASTVAITIVGCSQGSSLVTVPVSSSTPDPTPTPTATVTTNNSFALTSFRPASRTGAIPTSVQLNFNQSLGTSATDTANYLWQCSQATAASPTPTSVTVAGSIASVTLPAVSKAITGSSCTLTISASVKDSNGNSPTGTLSATYTFAPDSTTASGIKGYLSSPTPKSIVFGTTQLSSSVFLTKTATVTPTKLSYSINNVDIYKRPYSGIQFQGTFNTTTYPNGAYTLHLSAYDANDNEYPDIATPVEITIQNLSASLSTACAHAGGSAGLAGSTTVCIIRGTECPSSLIAYGDGKWTTTAATYCKGVSTTGCAIASGMGTGTTAFHTAFIDKAPETISVANVAACGPATLGYTTCTATVTSIGCILN